MSINEIVNDINSHDELAADVVEGKVVVSKVDDRPIGNELIGDYVERIVGDVVKSLKIVDADESASVATYEVAK